jgi:hypothetical protein
LTWIKKIGVSANCVRRGLIRSAHSGNFKTGLFDGGDEPFARLIWINATGSRSALPTKVYSQRPRSVIVGEEAKADKTQVQILRDAFEGMKGRQPKSDRELNEWLAADEGRLATMFEPTLLSRWGETGHA